MPRNRTAIILIAVLLFGGAIAFTATRVRSLQGNLGTGPASGMPAPEFTGISTWINSKPLTLADLRGKVVWIDFWTFSCINCIRTLPAVRALYDRYHAYGFEVVGVHSPEFGFEKSAPNVRAAVERNMLRYPNAMDNDMATWRAYHNQYWPRVYLLDAKGKIRFDHIGEGGEDELQTQVRALLRETSATLPPRVDLTADLPSAHITPEIYAGFERGSQQGSLANPEGYQPSVIVNYKPVSASAVTAAGVDGAFFLEGKWSASGEYVQAAEDGARIVLHFFARKVFFVAAPSGAPARAHLSVDGTTPATGGDLVVNRDDLFSALALPQASEHVLTITASKGFRLYTFTFG